MEQYERYAIYVAPPAESSLGRFGYGWMGFDPQSGKSLRLPDINGLSQEEILRARASQTKYGFHGTLKAPFRLNAETSVNDLQKAIVALCAQLQPFTLPGLKVSSLGSFLALVPLTRSLDLIDLAETCVQQLDKFRAPLTEAEMERRRAANLTPRQEMYLEAWGYPYVLDEFRFHLTLTGRLARLEREKFLALMEDAKAHIFQEPVPVTEICLYGDPGKDRKFRLLHRFPFGQAVSSSEKFTTPMPVKMI